ARRTPRSPGCRGAPSVTPALPTRLPGRHCEQGPVTTCHSEPAALATRTARSLRPSPTGAGALQGICDALLLLFRHVWIDREDDALVLCRFGVWKPERRRPLAVDGLSMAAHDSSTGRDAIVEHPLHDRALITLLREPHTEALPVAPCPLGFPGELESGHVAKECPVSLHERTADPDDLWESFQLL